MRLDSVIINNFRGYQDERKIDIGPLTALIGKNDVGKSTILEALDAFFNDIADPSDLNARAAERRFTIGCVFSHLPDEIQVDAQSITSLQEEYLLNGDSKFEVYQTWRCTNTKTEVERVFAKALIPHDERVDGLLFKKNNELKQLVEAAGLDADRRSNADMRRAIYGSLGPPNEIELVEREVELDKPKADSGQFEDARKIWKKLRDRHLPVYSLFKSEQVRGDKEPAVRSPLDGTLKRAVKELDDQLAEIAERIQEAVSDTTQRTLERLRRDYPELGSTLIPDYKPPNWSKAFDLDVLRGDDDVPLNKRGAGVRRLVVLAFFQAEAEKKREGRREGIQAPPVIYAMEEPETSQHPDFQRNIISALEELAGSGDQVLVTTHVPGLAELLPVESIRYIDLPDGEVTPRIRSGIDDQKVLTEAAHSLGVLPTVIPSKGAQVAIWVEGESDVWAMDAFASRLREQGLMPEPLDQDRLYYVVGAGGDKLKAFVTGEYLDALGLPQFYLRDSDKEARDGAGKAIPDAVKRRVDAWKEDGVGVPIKVLLTRKREIENYVHLSAVDRVLGGPAEMANRLSGVDLDFAQVSKSDGPLWEALADAKRDLGARYPEATRRGVELDYRKPKHVICGLLIPEMTIEEIRERCATTDDGEGQSEVERWFSHMAELVFLG